MNMATVDAHGMFLYASLLAAIYIYSLDVLACLQGLHYKIIGVGFALLVRLNRAMRRPLNVERVTKSDLHAFSLYML